MIKFMRDKDGKLYAVKDGKVIGAINTIEAPKEKKKEKNNGTGS